MSKIKPQRRSMKHLVLISAFALLLAGPAWSEFSGFPEGGFQPSDKEQLWEETAPAWGGEAALEKVTVQAGETLSEIAKRVYGEASQWPLIYDANRDQIEDPSQVPAGTELVIPAQ